MELKGRCILGKVNVYYNYHIIEKVVPQVVLELFKLIK